MTLKILLLWQERQGLGGTSCSVTGCQNHSSYTKTSYNSENSTTLTRETEAGWDLICCDRFLTTRRPWNDLGWDPCCAVTGFWQEFPNIIVYKWNKLIHDKWIINKMNLRWLLWQERHGLGGTVLCCDRFLTTQRPWNYQSEPNLDAQSDRYKYRDTKSNNNTTRIQNGRE